MNINELGEYLFKKTTGKYDRIQYDTFLKKEKFVFDIPSVHITGSNGKGSTATFLSLIYQKAGYKVGLFTSPFFYSPTEMIKVNNVDISNEEFLSIFNEHQSDFEKFELSPFEIETFMAFTYFKRCNCDICIIEVGMGGITDATNCFTPVLSIITSICLEHTFYLGTTYSEIAANKAGIIKRDVPVLIGTLEETARTTIYEIAKENNSKVFELDSYYFLKQLGNKGFEFDYRPYTSLKVPCLITSQVTDACFAIESTKILMNQFNVNENNIREALEEFKLICRGERFGNIFLDGAHNSEAAENLALNYKYIAGEKKIRILFASFRDKNISSILPILAKDAESITLTTFDHPRARNEDDYFLYIGDYPFVEDWQLALKALKQEYPDDCILVTGSLAFVGLVRKYLTNE